ncbi:unnamed protein product [Owenia fusiformis]|uniref:G protein-activated inward rectifier potassium channel 3 n=1 Tax=Owenia fusiformis TaxID=6347 RepID=A0A8J1UP99_OWEFU|nr:unnamed protein product [Owenia fusiformis]
MCTNPRQSLDLEPEDRYENIEKNRNSDWRRDSRYVPSRMSVSGHHNTWLNSVFRRRTDSVTKYLQSTGRRVSLNDLHSQTLKRNRKRLVAKNGDRNIIQTDIKRRGQGYLADIFVTLVDTKWRLILLMFVSGFILSWLVFALLWWIICFSHGDFEHTSDIDWVPCVDAVEDFPTALLFSIETQHTIGYGGRATTSKCPEAIILMMLQSCMGTLMQAILTGIVFSKIQRPKRRSHTLIFSKNAVICMREGNLCLLFRVGDMRRSHMIGAHIRAIKVKKSVTKEGEVLPLFEQDVAFHVPPDGNLFLVWPVMACHIIDKNSPFYNISSEDLQRDKFELIVILEGTIESTGMSAQARTSYLPCEILWGHRFRRLTMYQKDTGEYQIRYNNFHATVPVDTPNCSAKAMFDNPDMDTNYPSEYEETILPTPSSEYPPIPNFNVPIVTFEDTDKLNKDEEAFLCDINDGDHQREECDLCNNNLINQSSQCRELKLDPTELHSDSNTKTQNGDAKIVSNVTNLAENTDADHLKPPSRKIIKSKGSKIFTVEKADHIPVSLAKPGIMKLKNRKDSCTSSDTDSPVKERPAPLVRMRSDSSISLDTMDDYDDYIDRKTEANTLRNLREISPTGI